jgi:hypothetical protein
MVTIAGALAKAHAKGTNSRRKPQVKAIHLKEISERPSTYFFAVRDSFSKTTLAVPTSHTCVIKHVQLRLDKSDVVEFARQRALMLGVNFKVTARTSADLATDLIKAANSRVLNILHHFPPSFAVYD